MNYEIGDTVKLKCGSPIMVVVSYRTQMGAQSVDLLWIDSTGSPQKMEHVDCRIIVSANPTV